MHSEPSIVAAPDVSWVVLLAICLALFSFFHLPSRLLFLSNCLLPFRSFALSDFLSCIAATSLVCWLVQFLPSRSLQLALHGMMATPPCCCICSVHLCLVVGDHRPRRYNRRHRRGHQRAGCAVDGCKYQFNGKNTHSIGKKKKPGCQGSGRVLCCSGRRRRTRPAAW